MSYRLTKKAAQTRLESTRRGREYARMEGPAPDYPAPLPELVTQVIPDPNELLNVDTLLEEETYTCPIHGDLGGVDECPMC